MSLIPVVIENTGKGERSWDIYSRLLKDRIIFITNEIEPNMSSSIIAQLLFLDSEDSSKPIHIYINSPGGYVTAGFAIIDAMHLVKAPIYTYCIGQCASMGAMIFSQGEKGHRSILKHAELMIHQPLGGAQGQATDIEIHAKRIMKDKEILIEMLAEASGQPVEKVKQDCERDYFMNAEEAVEYGIADKIL